MRNNKIIRPFYWKIGMQLSLVSTGLPVLIEIPEFLQGIALGGSIVCFILGILPEEKYHVIRKFKKKLAIRNQ